MWLFFFPKIEFCHQKGNIDVLWKKFLNVENNEKEIIVMDTVILKILGI